MSKTTDGLVGILSSASATEVGTIISANQEKMFTDDRPFASYFKKLLQERGLSQNFVIEKAGFTPQYGYRLLSEERRTKQRDYILRFCIVAGISLDDIQRLLQLYGMAPLYARIPRDAVIIAAISLGKNSISDVDELLKENGYEKLRCSEL